MRQAAASLGVIALCSIAAPAASQAPANERPSISIPATSLDRALDAIAKKAKVRIRFDRADAARYQAPAIDTDNASAAIQEAVSRSPLSVEAFRGGFLVGRPSKSDPSEIVVTATRDEAETNYGARSTSSATRDGTTLRSQPQSTTVITGKVIADQQIQNVSDALRNASGSTVNLGNVQGAVNYTVRGFSVTPTSGGLLSAGANAQPISNVERIEVLKGPAAILAGQDNLGGVVNIVRKRPSADPILDVTAEYASYNDVKGTIDGSTALSPNKAVSARLVLSGARSDRNFAGYDGRREYLIAPSLRYKLAKTDIVAGASLSKQASAIPPYGYFDSNRKFFDLSDRTIGPKDQGIDQELMEFYYEASQGIFDWLTLVSRGQYTENEQALKIAAPAAYISPNILRFSKFSSRQVRTSYAIDNYARVKFDTFGIRHTIVGGYNYSRNINRAATVPTLASDPTFPTINLSAPFTIAPFRYASVDVNRLRSEQNGYYVQDLIEFGPVHVTGGVRRTDTSVTNFVFRNSRTTATSRGATVPNVGAVVDLSQQISIYGNYIEGFSPTNFLNRAGDILPNRTSTNIEGGVKADLAGGRLGIVASVFRLREFGLVLPDETEPFVPNAYIPLPGQEARGVELDVNGRILPGWQIAASYSYATYKQLDPVNNDPVLAQPEHKYSLFTTYEIQRGAFKSLGAGVGVYGFSESLAGFDRSFPAGQQNYILPGQTEVNANLYYTAGKFRFNFGVTNVFDRTLFGVATNTTYIPRRDPRQFRLTVVYKAF